MLWQAAKPVTWTSQAAEPSGQDFAMSKNSLILVLQNKQENSTIDMTKLHIKSEKLTPFGGIFSGHGAI